MKSKRIITQTIIGFVIIMLLAAIFIFTRAVAGQALAIAGMVAFVLLLSYVLFPQRNRRERELEMELSKIDGMDGVLFEQYMAGLMEKCGYTGVKVTRESNDYGADIIAYDAEAKIGVQCKRCQGSVGVKAVQEIMGGMQFYDCASGIVATNSFFTRQARELAEKCNVELWDRDTLKQLVSAGRKKTGKGW